MASVKVSDKDVQYILTDKSGKFIVTKTTKFNSAKNQFSVKREVYPDGLKAKENLLEEGITVSNVGYLQINKEKVPALRPKLSRYLIWLDGKKYYSEIKINVSKKIITVDKSSPEDKWNGVETFKIPEHKGIFCFYNQLIECVKTTGFFRKSAEKEAGSISIQLIWDGYPYIHEQYEGASSELFTVATMNFESISKDGFINYSLNFDDQVIFFQVSKEGVLIKQDWISQEFSLKKSN
ncbi:MAG: hypothetical protein U0T83_04965 [Bacteriovoracaceae bacterium]